jgi:hypothetical protein
MVSRFEASASLSDAKLIGEGLGCGRRLHHRYLPALRLGYRQGPIKPG